MKQLNFIVGGPAGSGIDSVGHSVALAWHREGLQVMTAAEYQNKIRGGHSFVGVHIAEKEVLSHQLHYDLMIAMDQQSIEEHHQEIDDGGCIIFDSDKVKIEQLTKLNISPKINLISIPLVKLAKEAGLLLAANVVAIGAMYALLGRSKQQMEQVLKTIFERKGEEIVNINLRALQAGFDFTKQKYGQKLAFTIQGDGKKRALIHGNEAICLGAIRAGCKLLAAYPMTPGSTILTVLAKESRNYDIVVTHVEDEIAAAMMAIGSNQAGVRAATATSGGGFALMAESVSLCGQTEIPMVYFNAQRPGPSTGLPTRSGQADLRMAMHCGQGDFPRIVVAAGSHKDCVELAAEAFNLAEEWQVPVIFLTEKYLTDQYRSCDLAIADKITIRRGKIWDGKGEFKRFAETEDGVSPRAFVGMTGGEHTATSYEHGEDGNPVEEIKPAQAMMDKRWRKFKSIEQALPDPIRYSKSKTKLVVWGGTLNPALAAQAILKSKNIELEIVQMQYILPFKTEVVRAILKDSTYLIAEGNQSGQLASVIAEYTGLKPDYQILQYHGRPMTGEGISEEVEKYLTSKD